MKYCQFDGCTNKIAKGIYCAEHKRSSKSRKKKQKAKSVYHHENKPFYRTQAWKDMRQFIYEREGGHCQRCGQFIFGKRAHVHHIVPIKDNELLKLDPNNLMLLCSKCHPIVENETEEKKVFPSYFN
ncbi:HNH endonuclease [Enterococcus mundtii]|uniref:HNH endonuclease n=1 Tax=Enterococcus mundtii TaxID=53346 RepID=UPI00090031E7|nr:HNH endonuclease signature motif containing protein [Enterococcus mundtii]AUB52996.1 endonuclease [Enterococcus mundtii]MZZ58363.1 HNH endonuclease [Enterococcus mundtii]MZZ61339.1 HNH endonuclease [Enterococcus mundtii]MZZ68323.1 HNH endonuclease [Enterococcus mundtii]MZZ97174.1 HNH endonuclease [Enterococcus mundtii]